MPGDQSEDNDLAVHLVWLSTEDGGHVLTVTFGRKLLLYATMTAVDSDCNSDRRASWQLLRETWLAGSSTSFIVWVRNGLFAVGLRSEIHVYSQWRGRSMSNAAAPLDGCGGTPKPQNGGQGHSLIATAKCRSALKLNSSIPNLARLAEWTQSKEWTGIGGGKAGSGGGGPKVEETFETVDCGLFQEVHQRCPILPQYHPTVLMELLNYGKVGYWQCLAIPSSK